MLQTSILTTQRLFLSLCLWPRGPDKQKIISDTWISNLWSEYCRLLISKRCSGLDNPRNMGVHVVGSLFWLRKGQVGRKNKCPSHSSPKPAVSSHSQMATCLWINISESNPTSEESLGIEENHPPPFPATHYSKAWVFQFRQMIVWYITVSSLERVTRSESLFLVY